jgi:hypothetical protein
MRIVSLFVKCLVRLVKLQQQLVTCCGLFYSKMIMLPFLQTKVLLLVTFLGKIQKAYEYLPLWLQQGIIVWNKGNIELENGSKIFAYATSAAGVRGGSYNLIFLDEFAFVPKQYGRRISLLLPTLLSHQVKLQKLLLFPHHMD